MAIAVAAIPMTIAYPKHGVASMAISAIAWLSITLVIAAISMVRVAWPVVAAIPMTISMTIADPRHGVASMTIAVTTISMTITDRAVAVAWISIGRSPSQKYRNGLVVRKEVFSQLILKFCKS